MLSFKGLFLYTITFYHVPIVNWPTRISNKRLSSSLRYSLGIHMTLTANSFHQLNTRASYVVPLSKYTSLFSTITFENLNGTYSTLFFASWLCYDHHQTCLPVHSNDATLALALHQTSLPKARNELTHLVGPTLNFAHPSHSSQPLLRNRLKAMYYVWIHNLRSFSWISLCRLAHLQSRMVSCTEEYN
jgi:hypothetical protein